MLASECGRDLIALQVVAAGVIDQSVIARILYFGKGSFNLLPQLLSF
jgi:hypothetical protein